jgi:iron complex outermembrane receptor protein
MNISKPIISRVSPSRAFRAASVGVLAAFLACAASESRAQNTTGAAAGTEALEEIVVTAQRREENLEHVPVAVSVLGKEQLDEENITSQQDLQRAVSGLVLRQSQNQNDLSYAIRGQTTDAFSGTLPGVLPYINEIQLNTLSAGPIYDMQSLQVLKGPQGTLFGRNDTGGAVLYTTAIPQNDFGGYVTLGGGNYDQATAQGAINLPLIDGKALLRIAGAYNYNNGYVRDIGNGTDLGITDQRSGRMTLLLTPFDGLTDQFTAQFDNAGGNNVGQYAYSVYNIGQVNNGVPLAATAAELFTPFLDNVTGPGSWANYLRLHPNAYPPGVVAFLAYEKTFPAYTVDDNEPSGHSADSWYLANTTKYAFNDSLTFKNIVGLSKARTDDLTDLFGAPYAFEPQVSPNGTGYHYAVEQASDELQALGDAFDKQLTYIVGLYIEYQMNHDRLYVTPFDVPLVGVAQTDDYTKHGLTYAAFAQQTWDTSALTHVDGLRFIVGGRYTWDKEKKNAEPDDHFAGSPEESAQFDKPSWQVGLEYQINPNLLVYLEQRGSWRAGGFNGTAPPVPRPGPDGGNEFLPESVRDVEFGTKFQGNLAGMPVRLNFDVYNAWMYNIQRVEYVNVPYQGKSVLAGITVNIPTGRTTGAEADADLLVTKWLRVGGNFAYTDARFIDNTSVIFGQTQQFGPYPDSPKYAGTIFGEVTMPTAAGPVVLRSDLYHQSEQYFSSQDDYLVPGTELPGYTLLGARLEWRQVFGSKLTLSAYGKNLTDKFYFVGGLAQGGAFGINAAAMGVPRMYGLQATYTF